jgi:hypothetical protein
MPTPQFETIDVNEVVRSVMKLHDAAFKRMGVHESSRCCS